MYITEANLPRREIHLHDIIGEPRNRRDLNEVRIRIDTAGVHINTKPTENLISIDFSPHEISELMRMCNNACA